MMNLSSRWQPLLCMTIVLLGWLIPVTHQKTTSEAFKVLKDEDHMGGSCTNQLSYVDTWVPEVENLVKAATDAINTILYTPRTPSLAMSDERKRDRLRVALFAHQLFGTKFEGEAVKVTDAFSREVLDTVKKNFETIESYINKQGRRFWRLACDDTWLKKVNKLETVLAHDPVGTSINRVSSLSNGGINTYAWFDKGYQVMKEKFPKVFENVFSPYTSADNKWSEKGGCKGITVRTDEKSHTVLPNAQTLDKQKIIYFCPRVFDHIDKEVFKRSLTPYKEDGSIPTSGEAALDSYLTPAVVLLHEMTHQIFSTQDAWDAGALGYKFENCAKGKDHPARAEKNADTYAYFGMAMYLSQVDWHTGYAQKLSEMTDDRSS